MFSVEMQLTIAFIIDYVWLVSWFIVYKMKGNSEKCFTKTQVDVIKLQILFEQN